MFLSASEVGSWELLDEFHCMDGMIVILYSTRSSLDS